VPVIRSMQFQSKRPLAAIGMTESLNAKRVKYLSRQEESLMLELERTRDLLTEKTKAILDARDKIRLKDSEIKKCEEEIRKVEVWQDRCKFQSFTITSQEEKLKDLEDIAQGVFRDEEERFKSEIERLNKELAAEKARKDEVLSELEINVELSTLKRNYRLALHDLNELKERVWMGEPMEKKLESTNEKLKKLETVEELFRQTQSKLKDAQENTEEWRKTVLEFFGDKEGFKTPMEAKIRFVVHQQEMLVKAASPQSYAAMEEKGKKYEAEMNKLQGQIQELTKALQQNTKTLDQERTKGKEAKKLQLQAERKVRALQKQVDNLTNEQCMEDDVKGHAISTFFETQLG